MYWYKSPGSGYPGNPMYPGYPGGPGYPGYPGYFGDSWQMDYEVIERRMWSYYPAIYHEAYPIIERVLNERDDPWRYPVPSRTLVEEMVTEVERRWQWSGESEAEDSDEVESQQRRFLRAFLFVVLLNELLRRRRRIFR